jgi:cobalt/nickel transport system permease protein
MHIPDGYLSPSTCAVLYAAAAAGWYSALKRLKRVLLTRVVPLISVFAAFSFVVMMFNLPLPGGTTGHALGVTIAVIVLGPSGAILALSIAIAMQALFFGDGGISTLGANCFNMAIVGSLVAYGSYRLIAAGSELSSRRRVVAAAVAGYLAVNAAALFAAIEFGLQPLLFHDASGTPLYAPYPFHVAIPAMMIGHLTFAGLAETLISAGLVAYLQVADPGLLRGTSGLADEAVLASPRPATNSLRRLWIAVALLMLLTPLGILAAGTAWGEWSPSELVSAASQPNGLRANIAPSVMVPTGLQRLANLWTAPFPAYAPAFVKSRSFGYLLSAMFAVGFLLFVSLFCHRWLQSRRRAGYSG